MSLAAEDRLAAFQELLDASGETVVLKDGDRIVGSYCAIVNRGLDARAIDKGALDFGPRDKTHIEFEKCKTPTLKIGWHFEDEDGDLHRIQVIRKTDNTWKTDCETFYPLSAAEEEQDEAEEDESS